MEVTESSVGALKDLAECRRVIQAMAADRGLRFNEREGNCTLFPFEGYPERTIFTAGEYYLVFITDPASKLRGMAHTHRRTKSKTVDYALKVVPWRDALATFTFDLKAGATP